MKYILQCLSLRTEAGNATKVPQVDSRSKGSRWLSLCCQIWYSCFPHTSQICLFAQQWSYCFTVTHVQNHFDCWIGTRLLRIWHHIWSCNNRPQTHWFFSCYCYFCKILPACGQEYNHDICGYVRMAPGVWPNGNSNFAWLNSVCGYQLISQIFTFISSLMLDLMQTHHSHLNSKGNYTITIYSTSQCLTTINYLLW